MASKYKRILLKLSGEVLAGEEGKGINFDIVNGHLSYIKTTDYAFYKSMISYLKRNIVKFSIQKNDEVKKFMQSTETMMEKINKSFKEQLANLYQSEMIDTDAEMKVFETMLNSEGFGDINDFNIK